jgi:hypothetical protein
MFRGVNTRSDPTQNALATFTVQEPFTAEDAEGAEKDDMVLGPQRPLR